MNFWSSLNVITSEIACIIIPGSMASSYLWTLPLCPHFYMTTCLLNCISVLICVSLTPSNWIPDKKDHRILLFIVSRTSLRILMKEHTSQDSSWAESCFCPDPESKVTSEMDKPEHCLSPSLFPKSGQEQRVKSLQDITSVPLLPLAWKVLPLIVLPDFLRLAPSAHPSTEPWRLRHQRKPAGNQAAGQSLCPFWNL